VGVDLDLQPEGQSPLGGSASTWMGLRPFGDRSGGDHRSGSTSRLIRTLQRSSRGPDKSLIGSRRAGVDGPAKATDLRVPKSGMSSPNVSSSQPRRRTVEIGKLELASTSSAMEKPADSASSTMTVAALSMPPATSHPLPRRARSEQGSSRARPRIACGTASSAPRRHVSGSGTGTACDRAADRARAAIRRPGRPEAPDVLHHASAQPTASRRSSRHPGALPGRR
jgi:hypothetical protein